MIFILRVAIFVIATTLIVEYLINKQSSWISLLAIPAVIGLFYLLFSKYFKQLFK